MDQVHLHLLINHLPIIGSLLGALVLAFGLWRKSEPTVVAAYGVLVLAALGAGVAQLTGEGAEEAVEHLPGVLESRIERHEEFAEYALVALLTMGALAVGGLVLSARRSAHSPRMAVLVAAGGTRRLRAGGLDGLPGRANPPHRAEQRRGKRRKRGGRRGSSGRQRRRISSRAQISA